MTHTWRLIEEDYEMNYLHPKLRDDFKMYMLVGSKGQEPSLVYKNEVLLRFVTESNEDYVANLLQLEIPGILGDYVLPEGWVTEGELQAALVEFMNQDIVTSLEDMNPYIRMFAVLDYRVPEAYLNIFELRKSVEPLWLQRFYEIRIEVLKSEK